MKASLLLLVCLFAALMGLAQAPATADAPQVTASWPVVAGASELGLDAEGNLLVVVQATNRLYKYYASAGYDSVMSIGGQGVQGESFNQPTRFRAASRSEIYLLDYGNRRLVLLSTNLRVVRSFNYDELAVQGAGASDAVYLFPKAFEIGPLGEVYVLNQDDNRIYKFDATGRFEQVFGGLDYGEGRILSADDLRATAQNYLAVTDTNRQQALIFDNFGNFQYVLAPNLPFRWLGMTTWGSRFVFYSDSELALVEETKPMHLLFSAPGVTNIKDVEAKGGKLFLLGQDRVTLLEFLN